MVCCSLGLPYLTHLKAHVALPSTQPDVSKQHICKSSSTVLNFCCHTVWTIGSNGVKGHSSNAFKKSHDT